MTAMESSAASLVALKKLYSSDQAAKAILDDFANRQRNRRVSKVEQVLDRIAGQGFSRTDVIRVLRRLGDLEFGVFLTGRKGHSSRFEWRYQSLTVGKAASGRVQKLEEVSEADDYCDDEDSEQPAASPSGSIEHKFQLRPDWQVDLVLPVNLTAREAARLSEFIKTLPFDLETN